MAKPTGRPLKVLQVIPPARGGIVKHVTALINLLEGDSFEPGAALPPGSELWKTLGPAGVPLFTINFSDSWGQIGNLAAAGRLSSILASFQPDIIHLHGVRAGLAGRLALVGGGRRRRRVVLTYHNFVRPPHKARACLYLRAERLLAPLADRFIAASIGLADYLVQVVGLPAEKVSWVYNGLDLLPPGQGELKSDASRPGLAGVTVVGMVARLTMEKGAADFLRAASWLKTGCPGARFLIVGDGPQRDGLQELALSLGLGGEVTFTGFREDVDSLLREMSLFVLPSYSEGGLPYALLEAMAVGLPVVAYASGGASELIDNNVSGLLVPVGDWRALGAAILALILQPQWAHCLGRRARSAVEQDFTSSRMVTAVSRIYKDVAATLPR